VNVVETTQDTSSQLTTERVPDSVLDFLFFSLGVLAGNADSLLAVDGLSGGHISSDQQVLLSFGNVDTSVLVGFKSNGSRSTGAHSGLASSSTTTAWWSTSASCC
jgi:hypothetical protein